MAATALQSLARAQMWIDVMMHGSSNGEELSENVIFDNIVIEGCG